MKIERFFIYLIIIFSVLFFICISGFGCAKKIKYDDGTICNFDDGVYYGIMRYEKNKKASLIDIISQAECDCIEEKELWEDLDQ